MSAYIREQEVLKQQNRQFCADVSAFDMYTRIIKLIRSPQRVRTACLSICVQRRLAMPVVCMADCGKHLFIDIL